MEAPRTTVLAANLANSLFLASSTIATILSKVREDEDSLTSGSALTRLASSLSATCPPPRLLNPSPSTTCFSSSAKYPFTIPGAHFATAFSRIEALLAATDSLVVLLCRWESFLNKMGIDPGLMMCGLPRHKRVVRVVINVDEVLTDDEERRLRNSA